MQALPDFLSFAHELADCAASVTRRYFRTALAVDAKEDESPVTRADREAEAAMRGLINKQYPAHGIFGEEAGTEKPDAEYLWVLDPIDGTRSFIAGRATFTTLIALVRNGVPILGLIDQPILKERWVGAGGKASLNGEAIRTSTVHTLNQAMFAATSPHMFTAQEAPAHLRLAKVCRTELYGGDAYSYGLLARGSIDVILESDLKPYDFLPLIPIIEGAGGMLTDWQGAALNLASRGQVLAASNKDLHSEALALLQAA